MLSQSSPSFLIVILAFLVIREVCPFPTKTEKVVIIYDSRKDPALKRTLLCAVTFINEQELISPWKLLGNVTLISMNDTTGAVKYAQAKEIQNRAGIMAIIGPENSLDIASIHVNTIGLHVPHISPTANGPWLGNQARFPRLINMLDDYSDRISIMLSLITSLGWSNIGMLSARDYYSSYLLQMVKIAAELHGIQIRVTETFSRHHSAPFNLRPELLEFQKKGQRVILLLCPDDLVTGVLQEVARRNMLYPTWTWIVLGDFHQFLKIDLDFNYPTKSQTSTNLLGGVFGFALKHEQIPFLSELQEFCAGDDAIGLDNLVTRKYLESIIAVYRGFKTLKISGKYDTEPLAQNDLEFGEDLFNAIQNQTRVSLNSFDAINLNPNGTETIGTWVANSNGSTGISERAHLCWTNLTDKKAIPDILVDLRFAHLRVKTISSPPFYIDDESEQPTGYALDLIRALSERLRFTFEMTEFDGFGSRDPVTKAWSGLIGELVAGRADLVVTACSSSTQRTGTFDFAHVHFKTGVKYIVDAEAAGARLSVGYGRYAFVQPFAARLWATILGTAFAMGLFLTIVSKLSPFGAHGQYFQSEEAEAASARLERRRSSVASLARRRSSAVAVPSSIRRMSSLFRAGHEEGEHSDATEAGSSFRRSSRSTFAEQSNMSFAEGLDDESDDDSEDRDKAKRQMSLANSLYFAFAAMLWQSPESVPRAPSARVPAAVWYMVGVILVASYTANMVTFVTIKSETSHLLNIRQLLSQSAVQIGTVDSSLVSSTIMSSNSTIAEKIQEAILKDPTNSLLTNQTAALNMVREGKLAFVWEGGILGYEAQQSSCRLTTVYAGIGQITYGIALPFGSPYTGEFMSALKEMEDSGFLRKLHEKYFGTSDRCDTDYKLAEEATHGRQLSITYEALSGVFDMLLIAALVSLAMLACEWLWAAFQDVDRSDPRRPASLKRALQLRWRRMIDDARLNWAPFKRLRRRISRYWNRGSRKKRVNRVVPASRSSKSRIEPDQWKRYTSSSEAANLRHSISNPIIVREDELNTFDL